MAVPWLCLLAGGFFGRGTRVVTVTVKRHVRALRRRPVQVLHPQEEKKEEVKQPKPSSTKWRVYTPRNSAGGEEQASARSQSLRYDKAVPGDRRLAKVVTIAKSRKFREQHGKVLLEGRRLICDALEAGAMLQTLFFSTVDRLNELPNEKLKGVNLIKVKFEDIQLWSDLVTAQGIIGIFSRPDHTKMSYPVTQQKNSLPLSLICDNIRDPGNLGTILRSAAGAGCNKVLLTKGCVDAWEPKVLRAGMGAHFRIPVITSLEWEVIPNYLSASTRVCVADNCNLHMAQPAKLASTRASDYGWVSCHLERMGKRQLSYDSSSDEEEESDDEETERSSKVSFPELSVHTYCENWAQPPVAIVIGGETHGLSVESLQLAESSGGTRLLIPVVPGVDSLNSAMAASILLFEGRRQLQQKVTFSQRCS
ncbi:rRNA methyltransferase 3, mitochondrial isoform X2 [Microcaecilia unicolor]|uniref:rRNA methyltransferase 3, mitochondrial isoform X2 n=1 Tax=Microcaecilia unicolor TaxID=1415580 RepID=A0A6P7ZVM8_9AMPH|nr:rRNA methyltransferase 3, mitochondrial isoform X2 [Microcaecilia unicolor]